MIWPDTGRRELERFHQALKEEEIYWSLYENPGHARECIAAFKGRYN